MADGDLFVPDGAYLKCDKGAALTQLKATPKKHLVYDVPIATESDNIPLVNIPSFGVCSINGKPCVPTAPEWKRVHDGALKVQGKAPLLTSSFCKCQQGGTIDIFLDKEAAEATLEGDKEDRVDGIGWLDTAMAAAINPFGAAMNGIMGKNEVNEGIGRGIRKGVKGTWNGLVEMVKHPKETAKGLGKLLAIGAVGYGGPPGVAPQVKLAQFDAAYGTDLGDTHIAMATAMEDSWDKKVVHGTEVEHAEISGQAIAAVGEALVGTKGAGAAVKVATTGSKLAVGAERTAQLAATIAKLRNATKLSNIAKKVKGIFKVKKKNLMPEWLRRIREGNKFNKERAEFYDYNEVYVEKPDGSGYYRLDSYNPGEDIVSRKHTQLSDIKEKTAINYINEIDKKYPDGAKIADVPSNIDGGNAGIFEHGNTLRGEKILEVPVQKDPIPPSVLDAANNADVTIKDINGTIYNP